MGAERIGLADLRSASSRRDAIATQPGASRHTGTSSELVRSTGQVDLG